MPHCQLFKEWKYQIPNSVIYTGVHAVNLNIAVGKSHPVLGSWLEGWNKVFGGSWDQKDESVSSRWTRKGFLGKEIDDWKTWCTKQPQTGSLYVLGVQIQDDEKQLSWRGVRVGCKAPGTAVGDRNFGSFFFFFVVVFHSYLQWSHFNYTHEVVVVYRAYNM